MDSGLRERRLVTTFHSDRAPAEQPEIVLAPEPMGNECPKPDLKEVTPRRIVTVNFESKVLSQVLWQ